MHAQIKTEQISQGGQESRDHLIEELSRLKAKLAEIERAVPITSGSDVKTVLYLTYATEWVHRAIKVIKEGKEG